jgi:hypothetical protein
VTVELTRWLRLKLWFRRALLGPFLLTPWARLCLLVLLGVLAVGVGYNQRDLHHYVDNRQRLSCASIGANAAQSLASGDQSAALAQLLGVVRQINLTPAQRQAVELAENRSALAQRRSVAAGEVQKDLRRQLHCPATSGPGQVNVGGPRG